MNSASLQLAPSPSAPAAIDPRDATLQALLDESLAHPPEYGGGFSSHLPMALAALHGLGADGAQLRRFAASYLRRSGLALQRVERRPPAPLADPRALYGGHLDVFPALQAHFSAAIQDHGSDAVLREAVPSLMPGVAAAAFHGLIRAAHAVETRHEGELAAALAYWAARWTPLPPGDAPAAPVQNIPDWLAAVETSLQQHDAGWRSDTNMITRRMAEATRTTTYRTLAEGPHAAGQPGAALLALARDAAQRYLETGNFTVLHMATAMRAALVLAPSCPPATHPSLMAAVWRSALAARIASGSRPVAQSPSGAAPAPPWDRIRLAARQSDNDHTIKLVHTMAWLAGHAEAAGDDRGDPAWAAAAWYALQPVTG